jgi:hypothetical protein
MRRLLLGFAAVGVLVTANARAEEPAATSDDAKQHFNAGVALLQDPEGEKVEQAYREFKTAYDLSGSPKILGNMGYCAMRLERDGEAIDAYSRYLREVANIDPDERAQIVRDVQTLSVGVSRITLDASVPGATILDERVAVRGPRVTNVYGPLNGKITIGVRSGHHIFTAKLSGRQDAVWETEAFSGAKDEHLFTLREPPPPPSRDLRVAGEEPRESRSSIGPILVLSGGAALLVAGGITGIIALNKTSDIESHCPSDVCPRSYDLDGARSTARTFVGVTDLLLLVGTLTTLGGMYWGYKTWLAPGPSKTARLAF